MGHLAITDGKDGKVQSLGTVRADSRIFFFFFKASSLKYANWGKSTAVRSMQNKISFLVVLFSLQLRSCFSHLLISVFYHSDGNYSTPTGCYEHLGTEKSGGNAGSHRSSQEPKNKQMPVFSNGCRGMTSSTVI